MSRLNYKEFYPKNCPQELYEEKIKNLNDSDQRRWNNFKNRIVKSSFIKQNLKKRQSNICPICSKYLNDKIVIHHIDYDRLCDFENYRKQISPTTKNPNREIKIPNCESCANTNKCQEKLVLIHNVCHMILHKQEGRITKSKIKFPKEKKTLEEVTKKSWENKSSPKTIELVEKLLKMINENSNKETFSIRYNKFYIELKPENIIYFRPEKSSLRIIISYGEFGNWIRKLTEQKIECEIFKRSSQKLSFTINELQFLENI
jgi:Fe-S cluster biosynthesis and repair protein YggX